MASVTRTAVEPLGNGVGYQLTSHEEWAPDAVKAAWDGTNAAGNFVVAVSFYNDGGALIDRAFPEGVTNAPGDTGRTFFRPFKRGSGGGGGGIDFDKDNEGGWLDITANDTDPGGSAWRLTDKTAGFSEVSSAFGRLRLTGSAGVRIDDDPSDAGVGVALEVTSPFAVDPEVRADLIDANGVFIVRAGATQYPLLRIRQQGNVEHDLRFNGSVFTITTANATPAVSVLSAAGGDQILLGAAASKVGFFGKAPVVRQATPVTLADVIALLQAYGLAP